MHLLFHCIRRKISRLTLSWQVEGSSSYQAEWLFLKILNRPSGFRKIPSTLEEKVLWYMGFLSTGKRQDRAWKSCVLHKEFWLEEPQTGLLSVVLKLFLMATVFDTLPFSCQSYTEAQDRGRQHHRPDLTSMWYGGSQNVSYALISLFVFIYTQYN